MFIAMNKRKFLSVLAVSLATLMAAANEYYDRKVSQFEILPISSDDIVFVGNSITDGGEFAELFGMPNIKNRGISGDVTQGVIDRIHQVTKGHPKKVFLLIGINDVSAAKVKEPTEKRFNEIADTIAMRYEQIVDSIQINSPQTKLYVQSVFPLNFEKKKHKKLSGKEPVVPLLNDRIRKIAKKHNVEYIDLWPVLATPDGHLNPDYTLDGLHLTGAGYLAWTKYIMDKVKK